MISVQNQCRTIKITADKQMSFHGEQRIALARKIRKKLKFIGDYFVSFPFVSALPSDVMGDIVIRSA